MVQKKQPWAKSLTMALNLATNVAAVMAIGLYGGWWLDKKFHPNGYLFTYLGFVLGAFTAGKMLWDKLFEDERKKKQSKTDQDQQ